MSDVKRCRVVIDTNLGLDDIEAIAYLTACKNVEVVALTLTSGNAPLSVISENAKKVLTYLNCENIPIYSRAPPTLSGTFPTNEGYFGENAIAGIQLPPSQIVLNESITPAQAIIDHVKKFPDEVSLLCLGPLTNLAMAYLLDSTLPEYFFRILIMGGDRAEKTVENATEYAEFNAYCDPVAYRLVSNCFTKLKRPLTVVDFTLCRNNWLPQSVLDKLYSKGKDFNKHVQLMSLVHDFNNPIVQKNIRPNGTFITLDLFLACSWHIRELFKKFKRVDLKSIEIDGEKRGHTVWEANEKGIFELIEEYDLPQMLDNFVKILHEC